MEREISEKQMRKQAVMFEEARKRMEREEAENSVTEFSDLFAPVRANASYKAQVFIKANPEICSLDNAVAVYEVLMLPEDAKQRLYLIGDDERKVGLKKLRVSLHPDKNAHPQAKEAFQRASQIFQQ